ncbi:hypothetical protein [Desulforamulus reducens]|nr:hypothetical protein [Desulforamulus reducens]
MQKRKIPKDKTIGSQEKLAGFMIRPSIKRTKETKNTTDDHAISKDGSVLLGGRYFLMPMQKNSVTRLQTQGASIFVTPLCRY